MRLGDGRLQLEQVWVGNDPVFSLGQAEFVPALSFNTVRALNCAVFLFSFLATFQVLEYFLLLFLEGLLESI